LIRTPAEAPERSRHAFRASNLIEEPTSEHPDRQADQSRIGRTWRHDGEEMLAPVFAPIIGVTFALAQHRHRWMDPWS